MQLVLERTKNSQWDYQCQALVIEVLFKKCRKLGLYLVSNFSERAEFILIASDDAGGISMWPVELFDGIREVRAHFFGTERDDGIHPTMWDVVDGLSVV